MDDNDLTRVLLAELVDELGGVVKLSTSKILDSAKNNKFKKIAIHIEGDETTLEVFDEDESEASK